MPLTVKKVILYLAQKPKHLFLADAMGALLTFLVLFIVLCNWNRYFGMPVMVLSCLSVLAFCFCIYSITCFFLLKKNWLPFIRVIAAANACYCMLTMVLSIIYYDRLTPLGATYFAAEIIIITGIVYLELWVATAIQAVIPSNKNSV